MLVITGGRGRRGGCKVGLDRGGELTLGGGGGGEGGFEEE